MSVSGLINKEEEIMLSNTLGISNSKNIGISNTLGIKMQICFLHRKILLHKTQQAD